MTERALRAVACEDCERFRQALDAMAAELENARVDLQSKQREIARLKGAQDEHRRHDENHEVAVELFEYWREKCGHPKATFGPKREKVLLARLRTYTPRDIAMAIKGAAVAAYVDDRGVRHDDLELICRDEVKLESFIGRYERWKETRQG